MSTYCMVLDILYTVFSVYNANTHMYSLQNQYCTFLITVGNDKGT